MDNLKKKNLLIIILVLIIIILLCLIGYLILNNNSKSKNTNNSLSRNNENTIDKNITSSTRTTTSTLSDNNSISFDLLDDNCVTNLGNYYIDYKNIIINNIKLNNKNYSYKYSLNNNGGFDYYLNEKIFDSKPSSELVLSKVCNYDNYIIISRGWEGYPLIDIYDANGNKKVNFRGEFAYYNGLLNISEHNYNSGDDYYTLTHYGYNLKSNSFEKQNINVEKIKCDEVGYDC